MGLFRPGNPAAQLHTLAGKVEVEHIHSEERKDSEKPDGRHTKMETHHTYPIQPKKTADKDLPFIPASEVQKRDGKDGKQLRTGDVTFQHSHTR